MQALRVLLLFSLVLAMETLRRRASVAITQDENNSRALTTSGNLDIINLDDLGVIDPNALLMDIVEGIGKLDPTKELPSQLFELGRTIVTGYIYAVNPLLGVTFGVFSQLFRLFDKSGEQFVQKLLANVKHMITEELDTYNVKQIRTHMVEVATWVSRADDSPETWDALKGNLEGKFPWIFDVCWLEDDGEGCKNFRTSLSSAQAFVLELSFLELMITVIGTLAKHGLNYKWLAFDTRRGVRLALKHLDDFQLARTGNAYWHARNYYEDVEFNKTIGILKHCRDTTKAGTWCFAKDYFQPGENQRVCQTAFWTGAEPIGPFVVGTKWGQVAGDHWGCPGEICKFDRNLANAGLTKCFDSYKQLLDGEIDGWRARARALDRSASMIMAGTENCDLFMYVGSPFNPDLKDNYNPTNNWTAWYYANISISYTHWLISGKQEGRKCDMPCDWRAYGKATNQPDLLKARIEYLQYGRDADWHCQGYQLDCNWTAYQAYFGVPTEAEARISYWKYHHNHSWWRCPNKTLAP